jgi:hypothetical protein
MAAKKSKFGKIWESFVSLLALGIFTAPFWLLVIGSLVFYILSRDPGQKRTALWVFVATSGLLLAVVLGAYVSGQRERSRITSLCRAYCQARGWDFLGLQMSTKRYSMNYHENGQQRRLRFRVLKGAIAPET